jgi:hypothetical protein
VWVDIVLAEVTELIQSRPEAHQRFEMRALRMLVTSWLLLAKNR